MVFRPSSICLFHAQQSTCRESGSRLSSHRRQKSGPAARCRAADKRVVRKRSASPEGRNKAHHIQLTTGSIVELNRSVSEPVDIIVNNCSMARGEVVVVEGKFPVRIKQILSKPERLRSVTSAGAWRSRPEHRRQPRGRRFMSFKAVNPESPYTSCRARLCRCARSPASCHRTIPFTRRAPNYCKAVILRSYLLPIGARNL